MCFRTTAWAIHDVPGLTPSERLVLVHLSHHRNHNTGLCNPSAATISRCGLSRAQIFRALDSLRKRHLIAWTRTGKSNSYKFRASGDNAAPLPVPLTAPRGKLKGVK